MTAPQPVSAAQARRLLLHAQGLLDDPTRPATPARVCREIERLGYVQVDSINVVERAHHHILHSRFDGYRPATLARLLERDRRLFEHWTHDAAVIPTRWYGHWKPRFAHFRERLDPVRSRFSKRLGSDPVKVIRAVRRRIGREGGLMSADFEDVREGRGTWWDWKPEKAALEFLWRTGVLAVDRRVNFHKVYDLAERVLPEVARARTPAKGAWLDWACRMALDGLGTATPKELRDYLSLIDLAGARDWCRKAERKGEILPVLLEGLDGGTPQKTWAWADWEQRAARAPEAPDRMRLLSPFDPTIRDRQRLQRLFGFEYTIECFVPRPKRRYGYYVLPLLEGERLVGRADAKLERNAETLALQGLWWEPGIKASRARRRALDDAAGRFAEQVGARRFTLPRA